MKQWNMTNTFAIKSPKNKYCSHLTRTEKAQLVVVGYEWRCSQHSVTLHVLVS